MRIDQTKTDALQNLKRAAVQSSSGFTLIELLVVISIIGLLASVVLSAVNSARVKARDVRRLADARSLETAVNAYFADHGKYPPSSGTWVSFENNIYGINSGSGAVQQAAASAFIAALQPYLSGKPADPNGINCPSNTNCSRGPVNSGYLYISSNNDADYCILVYITPENMNDFPSSMWNMLTSPLRCGSVNSSGQCTSGTNSVYIGSSYYLAQNGC